VLARDAVRDRAVDGQEQLRDDLVDHLAIAGVRRHDLTLAAGVHHHVAGACGRHHLEQLAAARARHVVDDPGPERERTTRHRRLHRIDRHGDAERPERLDHGRHAVELLLR
jgi:hypothetical protein